MYSKGDQQKDTIYILSFIMNYQIIIESKHAQINLYLREKI